MRSRRQASAVVAVMLLSAAAAVQVWAAGTESGPWTQAVTRAVPLRVVGAAQGVALHPVAASEAEVRFSDEFLPLAGRLVPS